MQQYAFFLYYVPQESIYATAYDNMEYSIDRLNPPSAEEGLIRDLYRTAFGVFRLPEQVLIKLYADDPRFPVSNAIQA